MKTMRFHCDSIKFLGVSVAIPWEKSMTEPIEIWKKFVENQTLNRLLSVTQAKKVYALYGLDNNVEEHTISYQLVCENLADASSDEFEEFELAPASYIAFEQKDVLQEEKQASYESIYDEMYKQWIPGSKYEAIVSPMDHQSAKGYAVIESITPLSIESSNYTIEVWLPVKKVE